MQVLQSQLKSTTRNSFPFSLDSLTSTSGLRIVTNNSLTQKRKYFWLVEYLCDVDSSQTLSFLQQQQNKNKKLANAMFKKRSDLTTKTKILCSNEVKGSKFLSSLFFSLCVFVMSVQLQQIQCMLLKPVPGFRGH